MTLLRIEWKRDGNPRPSAFSIRCINGSTVGARDSIDECQTKPVPIGIPSFHAALEQMEEHFGIESWSIVFEDQPCRIFLAPQFHGEGTVRWQVLEFVVEQIGNHAMKKRGIGENSHRDAALKADP